jgi:hypothetical protein
MARDLTRIREKGTADYADLRGFGRITRKLNFVAHETNRTFPEKVWPRLLALATTTFVEPV